MAAALPFTASAGSVRGRAHARLGRNNQDAWALGGDGRVLVAVVADGCSAGQASEAGALLGARFLAARLPALFADDAADPAEAAARAGDALAAYLAALVAPFADRAAVLAETCLFTFLAAVVTPRRCVVLGAGDGLFAVDHRPRALDPGPDNAPAYLAYRLVPAERLTGVAPAAPRVELHHDGPSDALDHVLVATDGLLDLGPADGGLDQFAAPACRRNPTLVARRLHYLGETCRRFEDDATLAILARAP